MDKILLENYIRNALLTEQQRIDENRLLTLGLAGLMSATAFVGSISDSLARDLNIPGVEQVGPGVYEVNGKTFNVGYFLKKGKLKINSRQVKSLVKVYGPVIHKVLSALTKNSPQLRGRTKSLDTRKHRGTKKLKTSTDMQSSQQQKLNSNINVSDFINSMIDPDEDNSERIPYLKTNLNKVILKAESLGLRLVDSRGGLYFLVKRGTKGKGTIKLLDLENNKGVRKVMKQLEYMAKHG